MSELDACHCANKSIKKVTEGPVQDVFRRNVFVEIILLEVAAGEVEGTRHASAKVETEVASYLAC